MLEIEHKTHKHKHKVDKVNKRLENTLRNRTNGSLLLPSSLSFAKRKKKYFSHSVICVETYYYLYFIYNLDMFNA